MKIQELLMNIKNKEFKLETGLQVKKYLPIEVKTTIAQAVIYDCTNDEEGIIKIDSVQRYMSYVRYMITSHTNLVYTDEDYDTLCSTEYGNTNLLNAILDCFSDDAKECTRILNLVTDDLMHENSIELTLGKFLYNLNGTLKTLAQGVTSKIDDFKLNDILSKGVNAQQLINILNIMTSQK